ATRIWLEKEPPRLIFTWDDLVSKFINQFFLPSKTTNLHNEITNFQQRFDESFSEAWDRYKDLLRACPHHAIIESKSKVRYSRNKPVVTKVSTNTSTSGISHDVVELKDMVNALLLDKKSQKQSPAPVKAVEESCVTCGGAHSYRNFPSTNGNVYRDNIQEFISQASAVNYSQGNTSYRPPMMCNQIRPPGFPPVPNNQNVQRNNQNRFIPNQNRGNNFNQGPVYQPLVFQSPAYQAPAYQAPAPQIQGVSKEDFSAYVKANDAVMRNMQTQGQNMQNQLNNLTDLITKFVNSNSASPSSMGTLPSNTIANPRKDEPEVTKDTVNPTNNGNTKDVQPQAVQSKSPILTSKPVTSPIYEPTIAPVSALKPNPKASIPYPSRRNDERNREKANNKIEKFYQIFKDMSFKISFANALILMPKFTSTLKALIRNKEKLSEMARTLLNEHCSAVLLKKLPEKLGDPGKFLIPCDFLGMAECLALADLGASINLMPFSMWKRLSLPDLTPTCMTLELADRSMSRPVGVAEDVYVKVGLFHFLADFVVVDFDIDPRVPLFLERSFLKTKRALIDVFEGELTLRVGKEAITFNLDQTSRYSANYTDMMAERIDVIDMACKEYSQEVLGFSDIISSGNPTPFYDLIISTTSSTLTPFRNSDFLLEEVDAFLAIEDEPTSSEFYQPYLDPEGDILLLEAFLNDDPSLPPPNQRNYLPEAFLEGDNKLPVIIAKDMSMEEKTALITVLKSHKRAIAWKLSDIKGINPELCTHKILMEEDFEPAVQHQRRVNPKIHDVIKQEICGPCFVNGLEACDGEINLGVEENMISNEFAVKLCLEHEVKRKNKVVKKELIVALRGEIYFVKFIINPEEDDFEPGVIFGRSFLRLTKAITDFGNETITVYLELDPFLVSSEEEAKIDADWDLLLDDLDFGDISDIEGVNVLQFVCKMGKSNRNKRKYSLLEEERPVVETMAYSDKYKKILDGICLDKMKLDEINKEEEEAIIKIKGEALIEKDDPGAFVISIWLEGKINLNALADTGLDINVIPYSIYKELGKEEVQNVKKGITMLNHSKAEPIGLLSNVLSQVGVTIIIVKFLILDMPIDRDTPMLARRGFLHICGDILNTIDNITSTFDGICHQTFRAAKTSLDTAESDSDDEKDYAFQRNKFRAPIYGPILARYLNCSDPLDRSLALQEVMNPFRKICVWKKVVSFLGSLPVALQHVEWKPNYTVCFNKKVDSDGQWHAEIILTDPYGNIYNQSFITKKTTKKLAKYRKKGTKSQKDGRNRKKRTK
nr:hypothetical protein [Tanacetum cinerariifolium]